MWWQSSLANKFPALEWIRLPKRASASVFALFFADLLTTAPFNALQFLSKFGSFGSGGKQLNTSLKITIGVDSARAAATNDNRIKKLLVGDNNPIVQRTIGSSGPGEGQSMLPRPVFAALRVVDQICSYCYTVY